MTGSFASSLEILEAYDDRNASRLVAIFSRQPHSQAGFPRVRPADCRRVYNALAEAFKANELLFRTGDPLAAKQFNAVVESFAGTDVRAYPGEYQRVLTLLAKVRLLCGDVEGASAAISPLAARPYKFEADFKTRVEALALDLHCMSLRGEIEECSRAAAWRVAWLLSQKPWFAWTVAGRFASFIALQRTAPDARFGAAARACARAYVRLYTVRAFGRAWIYQSLLGLILLASPARNRVLARRASKSSEPRDVVVTRAMGGIGDLLMMTPGLRALSRQLGRPVTMVTPAKFFEVFENNPNVRLVDMDGPPVDLAGARRWFNFTDCPASAYEAPNRPYTRRGRVELFAGGMGIRRRRLKRHGEQVQIELSEAERAFAEDFLREHGLGERPLLGVQPFSREEYRNYPHMSEALALLASEADIIVFHHLAVHLDGVDDLRFVSTAGLTLRQSFALVARLDALLAVDSSLLHAASAFDTPVVGLFGPIDGHVRTQHVRRARVIMPKDRFPCAPCWRNEDEVCQVTMQTGASACLAAIRPEDVASEARLALSDAKRQRAAP